MMFSTKAEYGVRVMVELARRAGEARRRDRRAAGRDRRARRPAARLPGAPRRAPAQGRPDRQPPRLARRLHARARRRSRSRWPRSSRRWRARSPRSSASPRPSDGAIVCSRESDPDHVCPTKLLWTRVRFAIVRTLRETTLADLLAGNERRPSRTARPARSRRFPLPDTASAPSADSIPPTLPPRPRPRLEQRNHGRPRDQQPARAHRGARDPPGRRPEHRPGRDPRPDGAQRLGQVDAREHAARPPLLRGHRGQDRLQGRGHHRGRAPRARQGAGCSWPSSTRSRSRACRWPTSCAWRSTPSARSRSA